jgi:hypothetical protein
MDQHACGVGALAHRHAERSDGPEQHRGWRARLCTAFLNHRRSDEIHDFPGATLALVALLAAYFGSLLVLQR